MKKLFSFAIGNPPYMESSLGQNQTYLPPVYNKYIDAAAQIADKAVLIHPARFLFDAGSTPKAWNRKMLEDPHFKVLKYEEDCSRVFSGTDIKGGVAITYYDNTRLFDPIDIFTPYPQLNDILHKVKNSAGFEPFSQVVITRTAYRLTDKLHEDFPKVRYHKDRNGKNAGRLSEGHDYDMSTNIFSCLPMVFHKRRPDDQQDYIQIYGREDNQRVRKYIRRDYVHPVINLDKYKIFIPKANGIGAYGEPIAQPVIMEPGIGHTETFLSIGICDTREEIEHVLKYIQGKFTRALLGVLKATQDMTPEKWKYVPLQDFTEHSDIDWSAPIKAVDQQLYKKYGLSDEEIRFIEEHVKEMS